jgi:8-oxo-dGTP pyrophosphatase MutT (NUDIX family)
LTNVSPLKGAIEESESAENAALREAEEEIGLSRKEIVIMNVIFKTIIQN